MANIRLGRYDLLDGSGIDFHYTSRIMVPKIVTRCEESVQMCQGFPAPEIVKNLANPNKYLGPKYSTLGPNPLILRMGIALGA